MTPLEAAATLRHIARFLAARGWMPVGAGERTEEYRPPADLELPDAFTLSLPRRAEAPDAPRLITDVEGTLANIYADSVEQIGPVLESADSVMSLQIADDQTASGAIGLGRFDGMIKEIRNLIVHTAAFVAEDEQVIEKMPPEALTYLGSCQFLQTAKGSFVANVRLPSSQLLREASLLYPDPIAAGEVTKRLSRVLEYVASSVLQPVPNLFSQGHVREHSDVVNLNVLEDVEGLFRAAGETSLKFQFHSLDDSDSVSCGFLSLERTQNLVDYVRFVRTVLTEDIPVRIEGKVVELRSRNPQGNKNFVLIQADYENRPTFFAVTLSNERYGVAVQAHRSNRRVSVKGLGRQLKTQIKITDLREFSQLA